MSKKIYVRPNHKDILVPNPENGYKPFPEDGAEVTESRYIQRRLKDGDLVAAKPPRKDNNKDKKKS